MKITNRIGQQVAEQLRGLGFTTNYGTGKAQAEFIAHIVLSRINKRQALEGDQPTTAIGTIVEEAVSQFGNWSQIAQALEKAGHMPKRNKTGTAGAVEDILD